MPKRENMGLRIYDVGVDANDYRPVSLKQLAEMMKIPARTDIILQEE